MLFIYTLIASIFAVAGIACSAYLYGVIQTQGLLVAEGKRRERRHQRTAEMWQSKLLERSGLGGLHRRPAPKGDITQPTRVVVSPSQAINDLKQQHNKVPPAIKHSFLEDAGSSLTN